MRLALGLATLFLQCVVVAVWQILRFEDVLTSAAVPTTVCRGATSAERAWLHMLTQHLHRLATPDSGGRPTDRLEQSLRCSAGCAARQV